MNRNNHCNQDHLEVVKVMLPVAGPSLKIKKASPGATPPAGPAVVATPLRSRLKTASISAERPCFRTALDLPTLPGCPNHLPDRHVGARPLASGNLERGPASDRACQLG